MPERYRSFFLGAEAEGFSSLTSLLPAVTAQIWFIEGLVGPTFQHSQKPLPHPLGPNHECDLLIDLLLPTSTLAPGPFSAEQPERIAF